MKKIRILMLLFVISPLHNAMGQQYGWVDITSNIPDFPYDTAIINGGQDTIVANLTDVFFINDNEGWISTYHPFNDTAAILHTTDGGATFNIQKTFRSCNALWMLTANEGYAGGDNGFIYRTVDGGATWNFHGTIANTLTDISFPPQSADTGYACGFNGTIYSVTSTGVTAMTSVTISHMASISFPVTSNEGWVCGESIIRHFSGGAWVADQVNITGTWNAICFLDNQNGWAVGDRIKHTTNGRNWTDQTNPDTLGRAMLDLFFLNANEGWVVGNEGLILHTANGGTTWTVEANSLSITLLTGVQFTSSTNGYVTGNKKTLLKYTQLTSAVENPALEQVKVYPNPAGDLLHVSGLATGTYQLALSDLTGRQVYHSQCVAQTSVTQVPISYLKPGVYLIKLQINEHIITRKIVKQ